MTPHRRGKITLVGIGFRIFDSPVWGTITFSQSDLFEPSLNVGGGSLKTKFNFFIKKFCVFNLFSIRNFKSFRDSMLLPFSTTEDENGVIFTESVPNENVELYRRTWRRSAVKSGDVLRQLPGLLLILFCFLFLTFTFT